MCCVKVFRLWCTISLSDSLVIINLNIVIESTTTSPWWTPDSTTPSRPTSPWWPPISSSKPSTTHKPKPTTTTTTTTEVVDVEEEESGEDGEEAPGGPDKAGVPLINYFCFVNQNNLLTKRSSLRSELYVMS